MKVILLTDVPKVGNRYDVKDFKEGYAQNVLLSKGLAELATPQALAKLEKKKRDMQAQKDNEVKAFASMISQIGDSSIVIKVKVNEKGHLFKAVNVHDVSLAIKQAGVQVPEDSIRMNPIKEIGKYQISIKRGNIEGKCEILIEPQ